MTKTLEQIKEANTQSSYELLLVKQGFTTDEHNVMCMACAYGMYSQEEQVEMARRNPRVQPCYVCDFCNEPLYDAIKNYDGAVRASQMIAESFLNTMNAEEA